MFSSDIYAQRRQQLAKEVGKGIILISGNNHTPRNYSGNTYHFRQDSNFLYFAGIDLPGLQLVIDCESGKSILFGDDVTVEDAIWSGPQKSLTEWAKDSGIEKVNPEKEIESFLKQQSLVHYPPSYPHERKIWLASMLGRSIEEINTGHSVQLIKAIVKLRSIKSQEETNQITDALNRATGKFHVEAMKMATAGTYEYQIAGQIESTMLKNNCSSAYGIICSVHGEILHNETYNNKLENNQLLLIDAGAENPMHYASDITRTSPVGGKFNSQQKDIYSIVLEAINSSINAIQPGVMYRDIHMDAARIIAGGLKELGLMKGDIDEAVKSGAHAMFFPHGLGHMIGLDVHDMEDLGENYVGYDNKVKRSEQFGTAFLRLGRELQEGFVITVEPGIYFIPDLISKWKSQNLHADFINYSEAEKYIGLGGVRIEDNVHVTKNGHEVLGNPIPKSIADIENLFTS